MIRLYKKGDDIPSTSLEIGDIIEVESGIFVKIKEILKETIESLAGIKKINVSLKGEVVSNEKRTTEKPRRFRSRKDQIL